MNKQDKDILFNILNEEIKEGSIHNIRKNGESISRNSTDEVKIVSKSDKPGIDINVVDGVKDEIVQIPVIVTSEGFKDTVYNDFNIGDNVSITIIAGCAIHNDCGITSMHSGIHTFNIGKNSNIRYVEKHYGCGKMDANKEINTDTIINLGDSSTLTIDTVQISGVDKAVRRTNGVLLDNASLYINEKLMTTNKDEVSTMFDIDLTGMNSRVNVVSRSVASGKSKQEFLSNIVGNNKSFGHVECDAILMNDAKVISTPKIVANNLDAELTHEAAIGKINSEQIVKLQTLGLTPEEAEGEIIKGFMQ